MAPNRLRRPVLIVFLLNSLAESSEYSGLVRASARGPRRQPSLRGVYRFYSLVVREEMQKLRLRFAEPTQELIERVWKEMGGATWRAAYTVAS